MTVKFRTPTRLRDVDCHRSLNLLAHAQLEELEIGSRCGGHGVCGGDRVRVSGPDGALSRITAAERTHLTQAEFEAGWRLACQAWPQHDALDLAVFAPAGSGQED